MRHALVLGAGGFLGRHASVHLADRGWRVFGAGHAPARGLFDASKWGLSEWIPGDITVDLLAKLGGSPELLLICAGPSTVGESVADPLRDFQRSVVTVMHALDHHRRRTPEAAIVFPSSAAVRVERHEAVAGGPMSPYGLHKGVAENLIRQHAAMYGARASIVRFFSLYGAELRKQLPWDACRKLSFDQARFGGTGEEVRDFLHVRDAANIMERAATLASSEVPCFEGGTGRGTSIRTVVDVLRSCIRPTARVHFDGIARVGDPNRLVSEGNQGARMPGFKPSVQAEEGLIEYAAWFTENSGT